MLNTLWKWLRRLTFGLMTLLVLLGLLGVAWQTAASKAEQKNFPPPGQLVEVGGYDLHIYCIGEGSPTVILDSANMGTVSNWAWIQPEVAKATRVCAYDRADLGWSDYNPAPRTLEQQVNELHSLLQGANEHGPYILVGHSYGARVGRVYAAKYPDEVAGMVLMDAGILADDPRYPAEMQSDFESEDNMLRAARWLSPFGPVRLTKPLMELPTFDLPEDARIASASFSASTRYFQSLIAQSHSMPPVLREERDVTSLGDIPLLVLVATEPDDAIRKIWSQANIEMATLSTNGSYQIVNGATHMSLVYRQNDAQVCTDGILEILNAVHDKQSLSQRTE